MGRSDGGGVESGSWSKCCAAGEVVLCDGPVPTADLIIWRIRRDGLVLGRVLCGIEVRHRRTIARPVARAEPA